MIRIDDFRCYCRPPPRLFLLALLATHHAALALALAARVGVLWPPTPEYAGLNTAVRAAASRYGLTVVQMREGGADTLAPTVEEEVYRMALAGGLVGFVGPLDSGSARFAARAAGRCNLPLISPSATAAELGDRDTYGYFRRPIADDAIQGRAMAAFASRLGFGTLPIVYDAASTYATGLFVEFAAAAAPRGIQPVPIPSGRTPEALAATVAAMDDCPVKFRLILGVRSFVNEVVAAAKARVRPLLGAGHAYMVSEFAARHAELASDPDYDGFLGTRPLWGRGTETATTASFHLLAVALGGEPSLFQANAYDAVAALSLASSAIATNGTVALSVFREWKHGPSMLAALDGLSFDGASGTNISFGAAARWQGYTLVNSRGGIDWDTVGTYKYISTSEQQKELEQVDVEDRLVRWPEDTIVTDPAKLPVADRLRGREIVIGRHPQIDDPEQEGLKAYSTAMLEYLQKHMGFTYVFADLPCTASACIDQAQLDADAPLVSLDNYSCDFYGDARIDPAGEYARLNLTTPPPMLDFNAHWSIKTKRQACGVRYSPAHYTYQFRLFTKTSWTETSSTIFHSLTIGNWVAVLVSIFTTAVGMLVVEGDKYTQVEFWHNLWVSAASVVGASAFEPRTRMGKMLLVIWMFVLMIVLAIFTANMAAFLVSSSRTSGTVNSIHDLERAGAKLCFPIRWRDEDASIYQFMRKHYPTVINGGNNGKQVLYVDAESLQDVANLILEKDPPCQVGVNYDYLVTLLMKNLAGEAKEVDEGTNQRMQLKLMEPFESIPKRFKGSILGAGMNEADAQTFDYYITMWSASPEQAVVWETTFIGDLPSANDNREETDTYSVSFSQIYWMFYLLWAFTGLCVLLRLLLHYKKMFRFLLVIMFSSTPPTNALKI